jgi:hypothetical protein
MGYTNVVFSSYAMVDIVSPADPALALFRVSSRELEARVTLPTVDSDGQPLTGMTELNIGILMEVTIGENPFATIQPANLVSFAESNGGQSSTIFLTESDAGQLKASRFSGLNVNSVYWVAVVVKDDA